VYGSGRLPLIISPLKSSDASSADGACGGNITPACLQQLYGLPTTKATQSSNKLGVTGFLEEYAQQADLTVGKTVP
jgi:tripeptidyl-peptidase-1